MLMVADRLGPEPCAVRVRRHDKRRHRLLGKDGPCSLWSGALVFDSEAAAKARARGARIRSGLLLGAGSCGCIPPSSRGDLDRATKALTRPAVCCCLGGAGDNAPAASST